MDKTLSTTENTYHLGQQIGQGGQGVVFRATSRQAGPVAIKVQHFGNSCLQQQYHEERELVQYLQNKKIPICKITEMSVVGRNGIIVMKCYDKDLFSLAIEEQQLSELRVQAIFQKICKTLAKMHKVGVAHLDIKPENFLVDEITGDIDICDFGSSLKANDKGEIIVLDPITRGTKQYMAPEMLINGYKVDGLKCDSFALGVTLYALLFRTYPLRDLQLLERASISGECKDLLVSLLKPNPNERMSVIKAATHPWVHTEPRKHWVSKLCRKFNSVI